MQLDFLLSLFRPLLEAQEASFLLDCSERHVYNLLDSGTLRAINIATNPDGEHRALRIYRYTVEHLIIQPATKPVAVPVENIIPHRRPQILIREISSVLACTDTHSRNLIAARQLAASNISLGSIKRCQRIPRESLIKFLTEREII